MCMLWKLNGKGFLEQAKCSKGKISSAQKGSCVQSTACALQISMCFVKAGSLIRDSGSQELLEHPVLGSNSY